MVNRNMSESSSGIESASNNYFKDFSKLDGDACREDGTLKDASEMEWLNSPSETNFRDDSNLDDDSRREASENSISYQPLSKGKKKGSMLSQMMKTTTLSWLTYTTTWTAHWQMKFSPETRQDLVLHNVSFLARLRKERKKYQIKWRK